ncbi:homeobox-leucine zipper protein ROC3 isoform X1 [Amborella trichopoda]|uniref:homeobox-leucine zipper protein ROC3 isoform X1 n=1 Tax=Amborella trichopoda TaxID=13333 RepID=UPI0009C15330|nr:homeobox-leucine zipper protein ROC3 isoform X1 [Amborella trichopoda]XP_020529073.1 homeobox-leucine zipper protein ROC3 isoform X1 [Amborella trichopoda]XP_020529074.1 homeobox-leucine zipper protein ROC3 isoform X1 [Amborella trichopoda]XP_020529075.1 homeobox-leucine zipper protein ROC3 isoform X1 [Amborella trichopoda]|eukprot:XP_020529072.1 homeobox-leucine zipper protein ROC3 isoform X1 [Amborella trichopoda]
MYGDCQVMMSMGGNIVGEPMFPPSNLNFLHNLPYNSPPVFSSLLTKEDNGALKGKEDELDSKSGSGNIDGGVSEEHEDGEQQQRNPKRKRYHRHSVRQIQEMEALFKECPHPDDKQRLKLSQDLGLKPRQVKFWFQNRRTQMKSQQDRADNVILRAENENLKNENVRLHGAIRNITCPACGGPAILGEMSLDEQHLRIENARLKEELERLNGMATRYAGGRPVHGMVQAPQMMVPSLDLDIGMYTRQYHHEQAPPPPFCPPLCHTSDMMVPHSMPEINPLGTVGLLENDKPLAFDLAMAAMAELLKMSQLNEGLWLQSGGEGREILNVDEYAKSFQWPINHKQELSGWRTEGTRSTVTVIMNSITLVDAFLDANKWMEMFPSIVSKARTVQVITAGLASHGSGSLQLMYAEFQFFTPLVPTREVYFLRYCQQTADGGWVIVDFPVDGISENLQLPLSRYRRRPSGCVIKDMPNGYSRVTWVEHSEVDDKPIHPMFNQIVESGEAFGAQRWATVLQRQCERLASLMAENISDRDLGAFSVMTTLEARRSLMRLAQRMMRIFCINMSGSGGQSWTTLTGGPEDTVRITTRKNTEVGQPIGLILCAITTTWLPVPPHQVFDLLRDDRRRTELDVLSSGSASNEVAHIANGTHTGNCISLYRVNTGGNTPQNVELMLQESCTDPSASLVIYAPIDISSVQMAVTSEDHSYVPLLPSGFIITPRRQPNDPKHAYNGNGISSSNNRGDGCLMTVGVQMLASSNPTANLNFSAVPAINNHLCNAVNQIRAALLAPRDQ